MYRQYLAALITANRVPQAADRGGRQSQTIVEVAVVPGPNSGGPVFRQSLYDVDVSEGAGVGSTVLTVAVRIYLFINFVRIF